jgi:uncharacterized protein YgiM (DUF1202 family)
VIYNGIAGYASMGYLKRISQAGTVNADILFIRAGANTSEAILGYLQRGARVEILETKQVGAMLWGRIDKGWICLDYVKMDGAVAPPQQQPATKMGTVTVDVLNIRANAGTGYAILGYLQRGARVEILETKQVGTVLWGRMDKGWISMEYVKLDAAEPGPKPIVGTINTYCLRIRSSAGTSASVVGFYYEGTRVEILETTVVNGVTWGRTDKGWISMEYVS